MTTSPTAAAERASTPRAAPAARWKAVVRIAAALVLLGVVLWLVPWRDRLTWPSRYGEEPLVGRIEALDGSAAGASGATRFVVEDGEHAGTVIEFVGDPGSLGRYTVARTSVAGSGASQSNELTPAEQDELGQQPEPGLLATLRRLRGAPLALIQAVLLYVLGAMLSFQRWQVLLNAVHVDARFWRVQKLGFLGLFFSNIIPGMTGGDLVKAIMVARDHPEQRPAAVLSVIVDRAIGLLGLAVVASGVLFFQHGRFEGMALKLNLILAAILVGGCVVMSRRLRRAIRLDRILAALPFADVLRKLDRSALLYREARWQIAYAILVSLVIHGMILTSIALLGRGLGIGIRFVDFYALAPLALIAQSLPLTPGGIGVGEGAFMYLFGKAGVPRAAAFALSISYRAVQFLVSLIGGVLLATKHEPPVTAREIEDTEIEDSAAGAIEGGRAAAPDPTLP